MLQPGLLFSACAHTEQPPKPWNLRRFGLEETLTGHLLQHRGSDTWTLPWPCFLVTADRNWVWQCWMSLTHTQGCVTPTGEVQVLLLSFAHWDVWYNVLRCCGIDQCSRQSHWLLNWTDQDKSQQLWMLQCRLRQPVKAMANSRV